MRTSLSVLPGLLLGAAAVFVSGCGGPNLFDYLNNGWSLGICGTLVLILDVIALVEVAGSRRGLGSKVIWALLIIFAPVLGCILYYFFGRE